MGDQPPRHLPNPDRAIVEERRVREYLLNPGHPNGGPKARFFIARGFMPDAWDLLQAEIGARAALVDLPGIGHAAGVEGPDVVAPVVLRYLAGASLVSAV